MPPIGNEPGNAWIVLDTRASSAAADAVYIENFFDLAPFLDLTEN